VESSEKWGKSEMTVFKREHEQIKSLNGENAPQLIDMKQLAYLNTFEYAKNI